MGTRKAKRTSEGFAPDRLALAARSATGDDALTDEQYADSIAYRFQVSGIPAGDAELPPDMDVLNDIVIEEKTSGE